MTEPKQETPASQSTVTVAHYFDSRAANWSDHYSADPRFGRRLAHIAALLERWVVPKASKGAALDFGCGSGVFTRLIASRGWSILGIDASAEMVAIAKSNSKTLIEQGAQIEFIEGDAALLSSMNSPRDLVISLSVLEYIEDDTAAISQLGKLLVNGGVLVLSVPNRKSLLRKLERLVYSIRIWSNDRLFRGRGEYLKVQRHQYSSRELDEKLLGLGLTKREGVYLNAGIASPKILAALLEREFWAAMYVAVYEKM